MESKVAFYGATVKELRQRWHEAVRRGQRKRVLRLSALIEIGEGWRVAGVAEHVGVSVSTVYTGLRTFMVLRFESVGDRTSPGRPSKLTRTQKRRLRELVVVGPLAAGYPTGCWSGVLPQDLINREFGVVYNTHYICALLRNLGFLSLWQLVCRDLWETA